MYLNASLYLRLLNHQTLGKRKNQNGITFRIFLLAKASELQMFAKPLQRKKKKCTLSTLNVAVASDNANKTNRLHRDERSASSELQSCRKRRDVIQSSSFTPNFHWSHNTNRVFHRRCCHFRRGLITRNNELAQTG